MKKNTLFLLIGLITVACLCGGIAACTTTKVKAKSPEGVATKFLKCLSNYEFDKCRELGNDNTDKMIDMLEVLKDLSKEKGADSLFVKKDRTITIKNTAIDGKVAVVSYLDETGKEQRLDMVKEDGKWLVDMKKETPKN